MGFEDDSEGVREMFWVLSCVIKWEWGHILFDLLDVLHFSKKNTAMLNKM